ncbi:MAG: sulfatase, partial [Myxococcales bacterium]|nr:sulfatase [Myxococcales bacterium]
MTKLDDRDSPAINAYREERYQDVAYVRLIDHLDKARLTGVKRIAPPAAPGTKRQFLNPHSKLPRNVAWRNVRYGIWDGRNGRVDMRNALRLEIEGSLEYDIELLKRSRLSLSLYVPAQSGLGRFELSVLVDGQAILRKVFEPHVIVAGREWIELDVPLPERTVGRHLLSIATQPLLGPGQHAPKNAEVLLADLVLFTRVTPDDKEHRRIVEERIGPSAPMNVLVIVIDAVRGRVLDPERRMFPSVTPVLDELVRGGTAFFQAFGASNQTRSSTTIMFSGRYLSSMGLTTPWWILNPKTREHFYTQGVPLLPLLLHKYGFVTRAIANNQFIFGNLYLGLDLGFDDVTDYRQKVMDTVNITKLAEKFLTKNRHKRFFLFLNYNAPHTPYVPPEPYLARVNQKLGGLRTREKTNYLGEIAYTDDYIGRVLKTLRRLGLEKRTLIVLTSDHGEVMNPQHACHSVRFYAPCHYSHGLTFYDEELHVPLVFHWPGHVPEGRGVRAPVQHVDLAPTVMRLLGLEVDPKFDGRSLIPLMKGHKPQTERMIFSEGRTGWSLRYKGFKLIQHNWASDFTTPSMRTAGPNPPKTELYDLRVDPEEEQNLVLRHYPKARELRRETFRLQARLMTCVPR